MKRLVPVSNRSSARGQPLHLARAVITYTHYERFQRSYRTIYKTAARATQKPVKIYYPMKPLHDPRRGIEIGDLPDATLRLDPINGKLMPR